MTFRHVTRSIVTWSFSQCKTCWWWSDSLSQVVVSFFSTYFSLSSGWSACLSLFFFFNFSPYIFFYCFFSSLTLLEKFFYVFNSVLKLQLVIYILVLPIQSLFFWFVIVTIGSFVKVLLVFNCILKSKFILVFFFN